MQNKRSPVQFGEYPVTKVREDEREEKGNSFD